MNHNIGLLHEGQPVEFEVKAFQFMRYGLPQSHMLDVSRNAVQQEPATAEPRVEYPSPSNSDKFNPAGPTSGYMTYLAPDCTFLLSGVAPSYSVEGRHEQKLGPDTEMTVKIKTR